jgi:GMC oxidoreductase
MQPQNSDSFVRLDAEIDEFGVQRAFVQLEPTAHDNELWQSMDTASDQAALVFAGGGAYEVQTSTGFVPVAAGQPASTVDGVQRRDGLGTTHHEAGALWMGDDPASSVTDSDARFHDVANAYALAPSVQPTVGSTNPMLSAIALGRRLANHLVPLAPSPGDGPRSLFNGQNLDGWEMAGQGGFVATDGVLQGTAAQTWGCSGAPPRPRLTSFSAASGASPGPTTTPASSSASPTPTARAMTTLPTSGSTSDSKSRSTRPAHPTALRSTARARSTTSRTKPSACSRRSRSASGTATRSGSRATPTRFSSTASRSPRSPTRTPTAAGRADPTRRASSACRHTPASSRSGTSSSRPCSRRLPSVRDSLRASDVAGRRRQASRSRP